MAVNKLALIRYKTLDDCLCNRRRKWTLEDLIEKVSEALYEAEGIDSGVSRRTIQADIQLMRSDKLGYNAPIVIHDRKYYCYEVADYSITKAPINRADVEKMKEIVDLLKQFNGFSYFEDMSDMIARLENSLYRASESSYNPIQFEGNRLLKGLQHITPLYQAIRRQRSLLVEYRSFKAKQEQQGIYYPYLLKEYRNRWFLIAKAKKYPQLVTLALDRIVAFQELDREAFVPHEGVDFERYYNDLLGVTKTQKDRPYKVILHIHKEHAPYVLTKPIHHSQQLLKEDETGIIIRIDVVLNFELERELMGFGEWLKVLAPRLLAGKIQKRLQRSMALYEPPVPTAEAPSTNNPIP